MSLLDSFRISGVVRLFRKSNGTNTTFIIHRNLLAPSYLLISNDFRLQTLETLNRDVLNQSVHLLLGVLVLVSATAHSDSNSGGQVLDTLRPDELVEVGFNADILGEHNLLDELLDSSEGSGSSLLEGLLVGHLSEVDGGIPGHGFQTLLSGLGSLSRLCHKVPETAKRF